LSALETGGAEARTAPAAFTSRPAVGLALTIGHSPTSGFFPFPFLTDDLATTPELFFRSSH
jgi:hypothetical protein